MNNYTNHTPQDTSSEYSQLHYVINAMLQRIRTATLCKVISCTNSGGIAPIGYVDIQPLVSQVDGNGNAIHHGVIYNVPYIRIQGGANAVILDPQAGDIGLVVFCDRDISGVKNAKKATIPASKRKHDMSDAVYCMTVISGLPTQYVQFNASGITVKSASSVTIDAPNVTINGTLSQTGGNASFSQAVTVTNDLTANGKSVSTHVHGGVTTGAGNTGTPI